MYVVQSPLTISKAKNQNKNKMFSLNMNTYRNENHFSLNQSKINYKLFMREQIEQLPVFNKIKIEYVVYFKDRRRRDGMNVVSVTSKYFLDALVEFKKIKDDDVSIVCSETWSYGGIDKILPRVDIFITEMY